MAYRDGKNAADSSDEDNFCVSSGEEYEQADGDASSADQDSGLSSDSESASDSAAVQISSLLSVMEKTKEDFIRRNEYDKLKEKCLKMDSENEDWQRNDKLIYLVTTILYRDQVLSYTISR